MFKKFMLSLLLLVSLSAFAWTPTKPIEIVVGYPPGGASDKWARIISKIFNDRGWESFVTNKPGGDNTIAANYVAAAKPDGHTLYNCGIGFLDANLASKEPPPGIAYTEKSFTEIAQMGFGSFVLTVNSDMPVDNYEEFKTYIRKNPEKFNLGHWSQYTVPVIYKWAQLEKLPRPNIINYKGTGPQMIDLLGGHISIAVDSWTASSPHSDASKIKVLAVFDENGFKYIKKNRPNLKVINLNESYPDLSMPIWYGIMGPAGMPPEVVKDINKVIVESLKNPAYTANIESQNVFIKPGSPEELNQTHTKLFKYFKKINNE